VSKVRNLSHPEKDVLILKVVETLTWTSQNQRCMDSRWWKELAALA